MQQSDLLVSLRLAASFGGLQSLGRPWLLAAAHEICGFRGTWGGNGLIWRHDPCHDGAEDFVLLI